MSPAQSLIQMFTFAQANHRTYQLGFLKFEREKKGDNYYFSGFNRHTLTEYLSIELGFYRIAQDKSYIVVKYDSGIVDEVPIHQAKNELLEILELLQDEVIECEGNTFFINRDDILEKFHHCQITYFSPGSIDILKSLKKEFQGDDEKHRYFYFRNGLVKVNSTCMELIPYSQVYDKLIWKSWIKDHDIVLESDGRRAMFEDFITNVSRDNHAKKAFISAIGYLLSNYNPPSKTQAVILYDEKITDLDNPAGGTGKGILAKALSFLRKQIVIDGKKFNTQNPFAFQNVTNDIQIIFLDDVRGNMDFRHFYSILTEGLTVEQKNKTSWKFDPKYSPKMLISSNSVFSNKGNSNKRRQFILEFSDFYSQKIITGSEEPVKDHHGCMFFDDWEGTEWNRFFLFMMECVKEYLMNGLFPIEPKSVNENLLLQLTSEEFYQWVHEQDFQTNTNYDRGEYFNDIKLEYYGESRDFTPQKFTKCLKSFADSKGWKYDQKKGTFKFIEEKPRTKPKEEDGTLF